MTTPQNYQKTMIVRAEAELVLPGFVDQVIQVLHLPVSMV